MAGTCGSFEAKTIENPAHLLTLLKRNRVLVVVSVLLVIVSLSNLVVSPNFDSRNWLCGVAFFASIAMCVLSVILENVLTNRGAHLVERWSETFIRYHHSCGEGVAVGRHFPLNSIEFSSCRQIFCKELDVRARVVTWQFNSRENYAKILAEIEARKLELPAWPVDMSSLDDLPETRKLHKESVEIAVKEHKSEIFWRKKDYVRAVELAEWEVTRMVQFWNLFKDLGGFYGVNVMPVDDSGKPFDDWNKFREYLRDKDEAAKMGTVHSVDSI